jgi:hypothetical protein
MVDYLSERVAKYEKTRHFIRHQTPFPGIFQYDGSATRIQHRARA